VVPRRETLACCAKRGEKKKKGKGIKKTKKRFACNGNAQGYGKKKKKIVGQTERCAADKANHPAKKKRIA